MPLPLLFPLTEHIFVARGDLRRVRPWVGVALTAAGTVLIDSGNGPLQAAEIQAALDAQGAPPVTHILLTHHHWDHVFGNAYFPGATIVAHEQTQHHLTIMAGEPWSDAHLDAKAGDFPMGRMVAAQMKSAVPDWATFRAVPATQVIGARYELTLGGVHFLMEHVGGQHEPDQCIVHVQPGNVLFLGDAAYGRGPRQNWDTPALAAALRAFVARGPAWIVEGHRMPSLTDEFAARIDKLETGEKN